MNKLTNVNLLLYIGIFVLLSGNTYFIIENINLRSNILELNTVYQKMKIRNKNFFVRSLEFASLTNNIILTNDQLPIINEFESYFLVYFYSGNECQKCIIDDLGRIRKLSHFTKNLHIYPVFDSSREIEIRLKTELDGLHYSRLNRNEVVLPSLDGKAVRFFAVLTQKGELINHFFPDLVMPEKTDIYLKFVKEKYLNHAN